MDPAPNSPPFYGTIAFGILATVLVVLLILLAATVLPEVQGRPVKGIQQFGVVLLAVYWLIVFPKARKRKL